MRNVLDPRLGKYPRFGQCCCCDPYGALFNLHTGNF